MEAIVTNIYDEEKSKLSHIATSQQLSASNPAQSVWVEASAGTGKTKVLSDRVLRLLLNHVDPTKILCLTYTKAAAVEMNERIAKRLSTWAVENTSDLEKELKSLLGADFQDNHKDEIINFARTLFATLLDTRGGMKIQTIHSFCQDILKKFPLEAGVSPYFDVLDTRSAKEILQNIKLDLLRQTNHTDTNLVKAITYLTQNISETKFPEIMNSITENRSKISALFNFYDNDLSALISQLEKNLGVTLNTLENDIKTDLLAKIDRITFQKVFEALLKGSSTDNKNAEKFAIVRENNFAPETYDIYKFAFLTQKKEIKANSNLATQKAIKAFPDILEFMHKQAEYVLETENKLSALNLLHSTVALLYIAKHIIDCYREYKELYSVLDYEDLIVITRNLLENKDVTDWVLFKLDGGIDHILIDEAQDTSPNQWAIIRALTQEFFAGFGRTETTTNRTVFVVGDRKQSIYSFQGADPQEFDKMYHYFADRAQNFSKVQLDVSFRSTKAIMDCVNALFKAERAKKGVIPQNESINHLPYRLGEGGRVEILPLLHSEKNSDVDNLNWHLPVTRIQQSSPSNQLARLIASNIKTMVESHDLLVSKNRPLKYGDFMFLVQQRNSFVEEFVRACKELGVNVAGVDKLKLLEQIAVKDMVSLGKFLLLPSDDLSLAEVLKSPLFRLDDDDLFSLCYNRKCSLFSVLLQNSKYSKTAEKLKTLLNMTGFVRPFELFNYVLIKLDGRKNYIARMGPEVEDILDEFLNLTLAFEQKHTPALETFINWIGQDDVIIQKEMEQGESDTVKIMTVHGSKGLQAPIVILADTARIKNKAFKSELLWGENAVYFPTSASNYDTICKNIKTKNLEADFDEYRRLLYVALTRAEDRLYIAGFTKNNDANENSWYKLLKENIQTNIKLDENDKRTIYEIPQENQVIYDYAPSDLYVENIDYSHLLASAPLESPLAKPYSPSHEDNDEIVASPLEDTGKFYKRGTAIHKLLQFICTVDKTEREKAALLFINKHLPEFSLRDKTSIVKEVLELCLKYSELFSINSLAEVPIIGEVDGKIFSAKVDRLVVLENKVMIVDYKTNRPAAKCLEDIPSIYLKQLKIYQSLLEKIYPDKDIETYLLWTNTCHMMKV